ncbi:hypothetical protein WJX79_000087 [Trebouxia sp. C0005]
MLARLTQVEFVPAARRFTQLQSLAAWFGEASYNTADRWTGKAQSSCQASPTFRTNCATWRSVHTTPYAHAAAGNNDADSPVPAEHHGDAAKQPVTPASAGTDNGDGEADEYEKVRQIEEAHLAESMERLIMEAYKLLQKGDMEQAESLLQEGSVALEQGLGSESSHPRQAEILDQLSLFQFLQGKLPEAEMHARRSLAVIQDHFEIGDPAVCMCELRLGAILFSMGQYQEAKELITDSYEGLRSALGDASQVAGESRYYLALMTLLAADSEEAVTQTDRSAGLRNMRSNAGAGPLLVQAALREHNRLVDNELTSESWDKAAWLFRQEIRLRNGVDPGSEDLSLLLYQFATLQYTRGLYDEAEALTQFSLDIARSVYKHDENQTMLRRHRLGTVLDCKGSAEDATKILTESFNHFDKRLGPKNPLTGEAQFALGLSGMRRMLQARQSKEGLDPYSKVPTGTSRNASQTFDNKSNAPLDLC